MSSSLELPEDQEHASAGAWVLSLSVGSSLIMHLSALGLLAAFILPNSGGPAPVAISGALIDTVLEDAGGSFGEGVQLLDHGNLLSTSATPEEAASELSEPPMEMVMAAPELIPTPPLDSLTPVLALNDAVPGALSASIPGSRGQGRAAGRGTGRGQGTGSGAGMGQGAGNGNGTGSGKGGFFGLKVKGKSTVFVVDASRSMNLPHQGPSRTRFNRVKLELTRTINSMTENEKFFIIFFGDAANPMPANRMMEAEAPVRKRFLLWANAHQATGHTFPQPALLLALQLEPDQIYFLTDGEFDYSVVPTVTAANSEGVPIHSIGFSDNRGENFLMEIARRNKGTYTFIPPDDPDDEPEDPGDSALSIIAPLGK